MEPVLLGRTVRFHPCLRGKHRGIMDGRRQTPSSPQDPGGSSQRYLENGSDFPTGKPLPWVLVSTLPQCTATWQSVSSTSLQYSCCGERGPSAPRCPGLQAVTTCRGQGARSTTDRRTKTRYSVCRLRLGLREGNSVQHRKPTDRTLSGEASLRRTSTDFTPMEALGTKPDRKRE